MTNENTATIAAPQSQPMIPTGRMPLVSRESQQAEVKISQTSLMLACDAIRERSPKAFENLMALRKFIDQSKGKVFNIDDLNDFIMECANPLVYENQGESAHCVPAGEIQNALLHSKSLEYLTGKLVELVKNNKAVLNNGKEITLLKEDLAADPQSQMGFSPRSKFERLLQRSIARAFSAVDTGLYDNDIVGLRSALRGEKSIQVYNNPADSSNFDKIFADNSLVNGASFSIRWLQNPANGTHAYHYVVVQRVERDASGNPTKIFFHQTWGKEGSGYGPGRTFHDNGAMNGLESMSVSDFKKLARVAFIDGNKAQGKVLEETDPNTNDPVITGFDASQFKTYRPARALITIASTTGASSYIQERGNTSPRFDFQPSKPRIISQPTTIKEDSELDNKQTTIAEEQMKQLTIQPRLANKETSEYIEHYSNSVFGAYLGRNPRTASSVPLHKLV